jgi:hypothetical protein
MLRKLLSGAVILTVCVGFTLADEISALIYKVDGGKVTFKENKGRGMDPGPEKTLPVSKDVKVLTGKFDMDTKKLVGGDPIENGLKNEMFTKIDAEKGLRGTVVTDKDNKEITEIRVGGGGRGMGRGMGMGMGRGMGRRGKM